MNPVFFLVSGSGNKRRMFRTWPEIVRYVQSRADDVLAVNLYSDRLEDVKAEAGRLRIDFRETNCGSGDSHLFFDTEAFNTLAQKVMLLAALQGKYLYVNGVFANRIDRSITATDLRRHFGMDD